MEANPLESIRNNVLGTKVVADTAVRFGAKRFVLVSTDKALNPKAVYGQCKALAEWITEAYGCREDVGTRFMAVRFGNVLGSAGSVITIFRRQIANGGPVTITHPDMTRYFMTIPEAASLVVQAGSIGGRGEIFVLDMGDPVGILDLARDMIRLSGREPERDIPIDFIGVRAGRSCTRSSGARTRRSPRPPTRRSRAPAVPRSSPTGSTQSWPSWSASSRRARRSRPSRGSRRWCGPETDGSRPEAAGRASRRGRGGPESPRLTRASRRRARAGP